MDTRQREKSREGHFEKILGSITDGFASLDNEWRCTYVNSALCRFLDRDPDQLLGRELWSVVPELGGRFEQSLKRSSFEADAEATQANFHLFLESRDAWYEISHYSGDDLTSVLFADVTAWKREELSSDNRSKRLVRAIGGSEGGFWELDLAADDPERTVRRFYLSQLLTDLLGYPAEERPKSIKEWYGIIHPNDLPGLQQSIREVAAGRAEHLDEEYRVRHHQGGYQWFQSRGSTNPLEGDELVRLTTVTLDITERRQEEEHDARLATIVESSNDGIVGHDRLGVITSWNRGAQMIFGFSEAEMIGSTLFERLIPADLASLVSGVMDRVLQGQRVEPIETIMHAKNGRSIDVLMTLSPIFDRSRRLIGLSSNYSDVTQRKRMEAHTRQLNRALMGVLRAFPDIVWVTDRAGEIQFMNTRAEEFFAGRRIEQVLPDEFLRQIDRGQNQGEDYLPRDFKGVRAIETPDGPRDFLCRVMALREADGEFFGATVALQDVSEFRMLDDVKTNLIGTVSHQLKTPVTTIRMSLLLLLEEKIGQLNDNQREMTEVARDEVERLLRTLNTMLDLTRFEEGGQIIETKNVNIAELLNGAATEVRPTADAAGVEIRIEPVDDSAVIEIDYHRILHVLQNLLTNAIKHSPAGSVVKLSARDEDHDRFYFGVRDQGPGVSPEHQQRIFDKFFRAPGNAKAGTGLGLAIVKEFVRAHDGSVGVRSEPPNGAEFFFILPRKPEFD